MKQYMSRGVVSGALRGNRLILQGKPHGDVAMQVDDDAFSLSYGDRPLMTIAATGAGVG